MTPKEEGYYMPAEWAKHKGTWLSYPHNEDSWPGKIETIFPSYHIFVRTLAEDEEVQALIVYGQLHQTQIINKH